LKTGCCGFPVARERCFRELEAVEINATFYKPPLPATVRRWREEAPAGFEFTLKAWQLITHTPDSPTYRRLGRPVPERLKGRYGHFRPTDEVREAWARTAEVARTLEAKAVLFQTSAAFYPQANLLRQMYAFFKGLSRQGLVLAWEPRGGSWAPEVVRRVCLDLGLAHATDPLIRPPVGGPWRYFRLHGAGQPRRFDDGQAYTGAELERLAEIAAGQKGFLFFNNKAMWDDARRFKALRRPLGLPRRIGSAPPAPQVPRALRAA